MDTQMFCAMSCKKKNIFCKKKKKNKKNEISIYDLRRALFEGNLSHLERFAFLKSIPILFSRRDYQWLKFNFDYESFEKAWKDDIFNTADKKEIFLEDLLDIFYRKLFIHWKGHVEINDENDLLGKTIVSKLPNEISSIKLVLEEKFNAKIIYVERDLIGTLKSRTLNYLITRNINISEFDKYFYINIKSKFLDILKKERLEINKIKDIFNDKIFITSLEKITFNRKEEIKKVLEFCNLNYNEIVNTPTYLSEYINSKNFDKINDDEIKISEKNIFFVNLMINNKKYLKDISIKLYFIYFKELLLSLYLKFRNSKN